MGAPLLSGQGLAEARSLPAELVVAESVVVIKKLLQMQPAQHSEIIKHMAKLTDNIQVGWGVADSQEQGMAAVPHVRGHFTGANGTGQHLVAHWRVLRACAQDCA